MQIKVKLNQKEKRKKELKLKRPREREGTRYLKKERKTTKGRRGSGVVGEAFVVAELQWRDSSKKAQIKLEELRER